MIKHRIDLKQQNPRDVAHLRIGCVIGSDHQPHGLACSAQRN